jgi:hypothetical protein
MTTETRVSSVRPTPDDWKPWLFYLMKRVYDLLPRSIRTFVKQLFCEISIEIPVALEKPPRGDDLLIVFAMASALTVIVCFVVPFAWCLANGTLIGADASRLYFLHDHVNLLNYTLVCPAYVGCGAVLVVIVVGGWSRLRVLSIQALTLRRTRYRRNFVVAFLILMIALLFSANFMKEIADPRIYPRTYWFVDRVNADGTRVLGSLGVYYQLINFILLFFSLVVVAIFLSTFKLVIDIANSLHRLCETEMMSTELLRQQLTTFTQAYLWGKLVIAAYMINAYVWKSSQAERSLNLEILGAALTLFGLLFLSLPRYYIELQWYALRMSNTSDQAEAVEYEDLRPSSLPFLGQRYWKPRLVANSLDALFIGGFVTNFWVG